MPVIRNPYYRFGSPEHIDLEMWLRGKTASRPGELGFLQGLHHLDTLCDIKRHFETIFPGCISRVSSIWIDKNPLAKPTGPGISHGKRELGDLAVLIRRRTNGSLAMRMWLLQGKVLKPNWQRGKSSIKEIDLYEKLPPFDLYAHARGTSPKLDSFTLQNDFGRPPYPYLPFWSFLMFAERFTPLHPLAFLQWPSAATSGPRISFIAGLVHMAHATGSSSSVFGADVQKGTAYTEWRRLYYYLWTLALKGVGGTKWPGGPRHRSMLFHPNGLFQDAFSPSSVGNDTDHAATTGFSLPPTEGSSKLKLTGIRFDEHFNGFDDIDQGGGNGSFGTNEDATNDRGGAVSFLVIDLFEFE